MIVQPHLQFEIDTAYRQARSDLLAARDHRGVWTGQLSSSALATATAISALATNYSSGHAVRRQLIAPALRWLVGQQNADGGWGDTPLSHSNIATSMLVSAAIHLAGGEQIYAADLQRNSAYVRAQGGIEGLRQRYGRDKTFAVPILTNAAIAGQVDWSEISRLPFEAACLPQSWYRFLQLPVVSYAIPALVAVGQAIHWGNRTRNPLLGWLRDASILPSLRVLQRMQPASGGFLEAIPLTSFVALSLASCGQQHHPVTQASLEFIKTAVRDDGSWPIDTNLATWNTTLALGALGGPCAQFTSQAYTSIIHWLLSCQHTRPHPFTGATPGGWGWSDLSGAVPDADDTPGALIALRMYCDTLDADAETVAAARAAAAHGVTWLLALQNRDGGWPTFCRGWGQLPFDRSGTDLTAHVLRALADWRGLAPARIDKAALRGWRYLARTQHRDGSWTPLWFGNQHLPGEENPIYGTAKCLFAYRDCNRCQDMAAVAGFQWLVDQQLEDGSWGGGPGCGSVEETALAVEALLAANGTTVASAAELAATRGIQWLIKSITAGSHLRASPIGLYFAKLWYYESSYPLVFAASALRAASNATAKGTRIGNG